MKHLIPFFVFSTSIFCVSHGAEAPKFSWTGNEISVLKTRTVDVTARTAVLLYRRSEDGTPDAGTLDDTREIYLLTCENSRPTVVYRAYGVSPSIEMHVDTANKRKWVCLFYHVGSGGDALKTFVVDENEVANERLLQVEPTLNSNLGYIKIADGEVITRNVKRMSADEGKHIERHYKLNGTHLDIVSEHEEIVRK